MDRYPTKKVTERQQRWRLIRFSKLQAIFADNEITQGRLNTVSIRNKSLMKLVRERETLLIKLMSIHVRTWKKEIAGLTKVGKKEEAQRIKDNMRDHIDNVKGGRYPEEVIFEATAIKIKQLRKKGKEIRDLLDESSP